MKYFNFLNRSGNITTCCSSPEISYFMTIFRNLYSIIQILVPIVLICAATYRLIRLMKNPEEKNKITDKKAIDIRMSAILFVSHDIIFVKKPQIKDILLVLNTNLQK